MAVTSVAAANGTPAQDAAGLAIRTRDLRKTYKSSRGDVPAVRGLDLSVASGQFFGLLGPNGAGKSTTIGMLTTLVLPTGGQAWVAGMDVVADPVGVKRRIGVVTQNNTLDMQLYLRISPELYLKRLLVGGMERVFELSRNFRNEGISPRHNPEFTMLEVYEAFGSWETMAELVESMICHVAQTVFGTLRIKHPSGREINLEGDSSKPLGERWCRIPMAELVEDRTGYRFIKEKIPAAVAKYAIMFWADQYLLQSQRAQLPVTWETADQAWDKFEFASGYNSYISKFESLSPAEQLVDIYERLEPRLIDPTFVTRVPGSIIPLARRCRDDDFFADVYELAINGVEISPGYTELNDPDVQAKHFSHQVGDKEEQHKVDTDFLNALTYGMPPAGGLGMGIDRVLMMLTGAESIRDVILFPLMKPQDK